MKSRIQNLTPIYSKFQNILPDELGNNNITEELEGARNEINSMINDDLRDIKNLAISMNKAIAFNEFLKPPSVFKAAFCIDGDHSQNPILFYYAHWIMSLSTLRSLAQNIIQTSRKLKSFYSNYMNNTSSQEKRIAFNDFVSAYQDFNGYLISIYHTITQYYVLFVQVSNEIDPNNNKEETLIQYNLDMDHSQLLAAIKELLLHGNIGRLVGFPLIISALEGFITRELFNTKKSSKYSNNQIIFLKKQIPSIKTIIKVIEKLNLDRSFQTSSLKGLYDWQSIVVHRDIRANDYLLWFVCEHTTLEILAAFNANLKHYRDIMLEELQTEDEIQIK
jgi:hypothetical protein